MTYHPTLIEGAASPLVWVANNEVEGWLHQDFASGSVRVGAEEIGTVLTPHEALVLECALIGHVSTEGVVSIGDIRESFQNAPGYPLNARIAETVVDRISARFQNYFTLDLVKINTGTRGNSLAKKGVVFTPGKKVHAKLDDTSLPKMNAHKITQAEIARVAPRVDRTSLSSKVLHNLVKADATPYNEADETL